MLSRQNLPRSRAAADSSDDIARGGYVLADSPHARAVIIATGSEVPLALAARDQLAPTTASRCAWCRCRARRVFDRQHAAWRDAVLPPSLPAVAVEAGHPD